MLLGPAVTVTKCKVSSPTAHVVLLPPPSTPRKYATGYFYHRLPTKDVHRHVYKASLVRTMDYRHN